MDSFNRDDFTGTWRRLFSRVKKHVIWGVLKSVTGMQASRMHVFTQPYFYVISDYYLYRLSLACYILQKYTS